MSSARPTLKRGQKYCKKSGCDEILHIAKRRCEKCGHTFRTKSPNVVKKLLQAQRRANYKPTGKPRGRPPLPAHLKKSKPYVPTGKKRGRPAKLKVARKVVKAKKSDSDDE